ncbi:uncharacterized protein LOC115875964 [Sitophilus oryzae]|uniref:Uncharacterized protein LOC115875964 n=1 Tax=Sitophilus oryzae TaxID=7048 RepID=A0A6J2X8A2_SITOR|nr:uncharacterized protein LOC115875964 [Sitophilus oryzae]XP_030747438.1 uncharacterized protein LOC115875964 [Sitophilus oryzae]XP_030747439.1 uncharacterized protein LOC115875964 [Sitophilus oryzae]
MEANKEVTINCDLLDDNTGDSDLIIDEDYYDIPEKNVISSDHEMEKNVNNSNEVLKLNNYIGIKSEETNLSRVSPIVICDSEDSDVQDMKKSCTHSISQNKICPGDTKRKVKDTLKNSSKCISKLKEEVVKLKNKLSSGTQMVEKNETEDNQLGDDEPKKYKCPLCPYSSSFSSTIFHFKVHGKKHDQLQGVFECPICHVYVKKLPRHAKYHLKSVMPRRRREKKYVSRLKQKCSITNYEPQVEIKIKNDKFYLK